MPTFCYVALFMLSVVFVYDVLAQDLSFGPLRRVPSLLFLYVQGVVSYSVT